MKFVLSLLLFAGVAAVAQEYADVPTANERQSQGYTRFPNWQDIEIVRDGQANQQWSEHLNPGNWNHDINLDRMKWIKLQNLDLYMPAAKMSSRGVEIPFVVDLRYEQKSKVGMSVPGTAQGTINTAGFLIAKVLNGEVTDIQIQKYFDSNSTEEAARKSGLTNKFDNRFVSDVTVNTLKSYLNQDQNKKVLRDLMLKQGLKDAKEEVKEKLPGVVE